MIVAEEMTLSDSMRAIRDGRPADMDIVRPEDPYLEALREYEAAVRGESGATLDELRVALDPPPPPPPPSEAAYVKRDPVNFVDK